VAILVFDTGLGGVTVLAELRKIFPVGDFCMLPRASLLLEE
jgi:glutamate racemase